MIINSNNQENSVNDGDNSGPSSVTADSIKFIIPAGMNYNSDRVSEISEEMEHMLILKLILVMIII